MWEPKKKEKQVWGHKAQQKEEANPKTKATGALGLPWARRNRVPKLSSSSPEQTKPLNASGLVRVRGTHSHPGVCIPGRAPKTPKGEDSRK